MDSNIKKLNSEAESHSKQLMELKDEVEKVVVGQEDIIEKLLIALVSNGHVLVEGVPGIAKTLMIKTLSETIDCGFVRLQFTPDLLPADIIGTKVYEHGKMEFKTIRGPLFTNFVLADEINRAPPKVQSALLEAMQERQVSIQGDTHALKRPFFVLATQNPIESEGTYKLPEAQMDRFMFKLLMSYPDKTAEVEIIKRFTSGHIPSVSKVIGSDTLIKLQKFNQDIYVDEKVKKYVANLVDATRNPLNYSLNIDGHLEYGASPRASIWLVIGAKAHAMLNGRGYVKPEDVEAIAYDVLRHRILLSYEAEAESITPEDIIDKILATVEVP